MSTHRFILEPYKGVSTRHTCPNCHRKRCFSKYIDTEKRIQFPDYVGRCDHEQKCDYHFTPRDYFERNPSEKKKLSEDNFRSYTPCLLYTSQLKTIDIMHFGWNIGKAFGKPRLQTATFIKRVFAHTLRDSEISTIERKMSHTESVCKIKLDRKIA